MVTVNGTSSGTHGSMLRVLGAARKREVKATQNLSIIVLFFMVCWIPLYTINFFQAYYPPWHAPSTVTFCCIILSHLNSAGNPLLYAYHLRDFRAALSMSCGSESKRRGPTCGKLDIAFGRERMSFLAIYRSPSGDLDRFINDLEIYLETRSRNWAHWLFANAVPPVTEIVMNDENYVADSYFQLEPISEDVLVHVVQSLRSVSVLGEDRVPVTLINLLRLPLLHIVNVCHKVFSLHLLKIVK
ncbi:G-protein coupled adenosine receptor activity protein [Homalodisca vitripennis]|nr:G-protein coupled adenosine receptor activity protein [Homalodisca vitripennis]